MPVSITIEEPVEIDLSYLPPSLWTLLREAAYEPLILGSTKLLTAAFIPLSTIIAANAGPIELQASTLITLLNRLIVDLNRGFASTVPILLFGSPRNGLDHSPALLGKLVINGWCVAAINTLLATTIYLSAPSILHLTGIDKEVTDYMMKYLSIITLSVPFIFLQEWDLQVFFAGQHDWLTWFISLLYTGILCGTGALLGLGINGLPNLGLTAIAIAADLAAFSSFIAIRLLLKKSQFAPLNLFSGLIKFYSVLEGAILKLIVGMGSKLTFQGITETIIPFINTLILAYLSENALIVISTASILEIINRAFSSYFGVGITRVVSKYPDHFTVRMAVIMGTTSLNLFNTIIGLPLIFYAKPICEFFGSKSLSIALSAEAETAFKLTVIKCFAEAIRQTVMGGTRGLKDIVFTTLTSILFLIIMPLPTYYLLEWLRNNIDIFFDNQVITTVDLYIASTILNLLFTNVVLSFRFKKLTEEKIISEDSASTDSKSCSILGFNCNPYTFFKKRKDIASETTPLLESGLSIIT